MIHIPYVLAHFVGDFLLQNDWMAVNKKKSNIVCTVHILCWHSYKKNPAQIKLCAKLQNSTNKNVTLYSKLY